MTDKPEPPEEAAEEKRPDFKPGTWNVQGENVKFADPDKEVLMIIMTRIESQVSAQLEVMQHIAKSLEKIANPLMTAPLADPKIQGE